MRSNTVIGDRTHARGMVVSRIVRANIPVENGVVHLIDKPLMIVARSLFEYIMVGGWGGLIQKINMLWSEAEFCAGLRMLL